MINVVHLVAIWWLPDKCEGYESVNQYAPLADLHEPIAVDHPAFEDLTSDPNHFAVRGYVVAIIHRYRINRRAFPVQTIHREQ